MFLINIFILFYLKFVSLQITNNRQSFTFLFDNEGWTIVGNQNETDALHESIVSNEKMNRYIIGRDTIIHVDSKHKDDKSLWFFRTPRLDINLSNHKYILYSLSWFSGTFNNLNNVNCNVKICNIKNKCSHYLVFDKFNYNHRWTDYNISLDKDFWSSEYKTIYTNISYIYILGDFTRWYETIGLDNFFII